MVKLGMVYGIVLPPLLIPADSKHLGGVRHGCLDGAELRIQLRMVHDGFPSSFLGTSNTWMVYFMENQCVCVFFWLVVSTHLEKYESQWEELSQLLWKNKTCSKPPHFVHTLRCA